MLDMFTGLSPELGISLFLALVFVLAYEFINGFHDTANAIATSVSTRALHPSHAIIMAAFLNFLGAMYSTGVAKTIGADIVKSAQHVDEHVIIAALMGAVIWNLITWWFGLPSSSSHALIGGLAGAGLVGSISVHWGVIFDCERLKGSKPWANYTFSLSEAKSSDITINKGLALADDESKYEARLLEDIVIKKGELEAVGRVELQVYTSSSDVQTNNITTTLPYILSAKAASEFKSGSNVESDDDFRFRILLSMSDKSTAGSSTTYKSYAYKADERIEDIKVVNGLKDFSTYIPLFLGKNEVEILEGIRNLIADFCTVNVYYYSQNADLLMKQRIEDSLNSESIRPLTDYVKVVEATPKLFQVEAILNCEKNQEYGLIQTQALENLQKNLMKLRKIGESITLSEINDFLRVGGVKEVVIVNPTQNIEVLSHEIGVCNDFNISTATI